MNFRDRKASRIDSFFRDVFGWTQRTCFACAGSGRYDHCGSPPCSGCEGTGKEKRRPSHGRLYNALRRSVEVGRYEEAKHLARHLERRLRDSMVMYGWHRIPLTGVSGVDGALKALDRYFTGPR